VAGAAGAVFLGVLGYEAGRAGAGGDPALPPAPVAAAATTPAPDDPYIAPYQDDPGASGDLAAPTTRAS